MSDTVFEYTDKVMNHFLSPRNFGVIESADGVATTGDPNCGDYVRIYIKVKDDYIEDIKFKAYGCPAAIACCSALTEMAKGKHIDEASEITDEMVADALGGLPANKLHCSALAATTLYNAIMNYIFSSLEDKEDDCRNRNRR